VAGPRSGPDVGIGKTTQVGRTYLDHGSRSSNTGRGLRMVVPGSQGVGGTRAETGAVGVGAAWIRHGQSREQSRIPVDIPVQTEHDLLVERLRQYLKPSAEARLDRQYGRLALLRAHRIDSRRGARPGCGVPGLRLGPCEERQKES